MSIKVLHLITGLPIGGAEKVLLDLSSNLDKKKIKNYVIGLNDEDDFSEDFEKQGIEVKKLSMSKSPKSFAQTMKYINHYIKENDIDILHTHMFHPLIFAFVSKLKNPNLKVVFTSHNVNIGSKSREIVTKLLKPFRDKDIVFSEDMITSMYKDDNDTVVIPNGLDISPYDKELEKNEKFTFISIGVLREQKNQLFLPSCAAYLKEKGVTNFEIQIVGGPDASGDMRGKIEAEIKKYGVEEEINMMGSRRDIPELLLKAHCFVMPSHFEGLPIALLEAGAARLSVVTTPVGAIPAVVDEESGYLSELDKFAQAMYTVISHQTEANKKALALRKKIEKDFSIEGMALSHEKVYEELVKNNKS